MSLTGQATVTSLVALGPTFDSGDSAPPPSILPTTFTILTNPSSLSSVPTVVTVFNSNSTSSGAASAHSSKVSTGVVVGIAVAVFATLAIGLVVFMSMRHKNRMARRPKGNRKSWNKLDDGAAGGHGHAASPGRKGAMTDVPMRNVVEKNTASPNPQSQSPPGGSVPFQNVKAQADRAPIAPIITDHPFSQNVRHVSNNSPAQTTAPYPTSKHPYAVDPPPQTTPASSSQPSRSQTQLGEDGANGTNIPNPFLSRSPSNSSAYHSLYNTTSADHDAYTSTLTAFPAVQMALRLNSVASSTDYTEDKSPSPTQSHHPDISSTYLDVEHQHDVRKSYESLYEQYTSPSQTESRPTTAYSSSQPRFGAIQDIITALDTDTQPPTAWKNDNVNRGSSRLSLGEDLLDPSMTANHERGHDQINSFPLPPGTKGNNASRNPFKDRI